MECIETLNDGECLLVKGPANIEIEEGRVMVLGGIFNAGKHIIIPKGKVLSLKACENARLKIISSSVGRVEEDVPSAWREVLGVLFSAEKPVIVPIIGGVDTGKTTLTTFLGNASLERGFKVVIIDADVGQSDIGPPCFVSMGLLKCPVVDMSEVEVRDAYFVGSTTPSTHPHRVVAGVKLMVEKALKLGGEIILVDTPGWISGIRSKDLNLALIHVLHPSAIIALQRENEIESMLKLISILDVPVIKLPALESIKRDRETRKFLRETSYKRHLRGGKNVTINVNDAPLVYTPLFSGERLNLEDERNISAILGVKPVYAEITFDMLTIVLPDDAEVKYETIEALKMIFKGKELHLLRENSFENVLVALMGKKNEYLGIGIIKRIDYSERKITVFTPVDPDKVSAMLVGNVKVIENGVEVGRTTL